MKEPCFFLEGLIFFDLLSLSLFPIEFAMSETEGKLDWRNVNRINLRTCSVEEFEVVFKAYYRPLFLFAYGYVMDEMEADDIVQGAFSGVWEIKERLPENLNIRAYLYASVKHACLRYFKRLKLTDEYKKRQAEALVLSFAEDSDEDDREIVDLVQGALSKLSDQQRKIVEMHVLSGMKYLEIADALKLSENTVRTHLKRAYKILREHLTCLLPGIFV